MIAKESWAHIFEGLIVLGVAVRERDLIAFGLEILRVWHRKGWQEARTLASGKRPDVKSGLAVAIILLGSIGAPLLNGAADRDHRVVEGKIERSVEGRHLTVEQANRINDSLSGDHFTVTVECIIGNQETCTYASELVAVFTHAGLLSGVAQSSSSAPLGTVPLLIIGDDTAQKNLIKAALRKADIAVEDATAPGPQSITTLIIPFNPVSLR